jgi:hypothetical protein
MLDCESCTFQHQTLAYTKDDTIGNNHKTEAEQISHKTVIDIALS